MKRAICMLLATGSVAMAGEAEPPAPQNSPPVSSGAPRSMEIEILPDGSIKLGGQTIAGGLVRAQPGTCYFIRTLGMLPEGVEPQKGLIPLQSPQSAAGDEPKSAAGDDPQAAQTDPETSREQLLERLRQQLQALGPWQYSRGPDCTNGARLMPVPMDVFKTLIPEPLVKAKPPTVP